MTNLFEKNKEHFLHRTKKRRGAFMVQTNKDSTFCYFILSESEQMFLFYKIFLAIHDVDTLCKSVEGIAYVCICTNKATVD